MTLTTVLLVPVVLTTVSFLYLISHEIAHARSERRSKGQKSV